MVISMNILMVDREKEFVQDNLRRIREMKDVPTQLAGAYSAEEAMEVMEYFVPDLLITDILLSSMNGFTLIANAKQKNLCENFIILTSSESFENAYRALKYQVMDYVLKSCSWLELEENIRRLAMKPKKQTKIDTFLGEHEDVFQVLNREDFSTSLEKIVRYIRKNYTREISLTVISEYSRMSENSVCNLFKKELGITCLDFICALRLRRAVELLLDERRQTVSEIAVQVGYHSERQLFRIFKDKLNMTPTQLFQKYY